MTRLILALAAVVTIVGMRASFLTWDAFDQIETRADVMRAWWKAPDAIYFCSDNGTCTIAQTHPRELVCTDGTGDWWPARAGTMSCFMADQPKGSSAWQ